MDELFIPVEVRPDAISLVGGRAWQASALFEAMHAEAWWPDPAASPPEGVDDDRGGGPEERPGC